MFSENLAGALLRYDQALLVLWQEPGLQRVPDAAGPVYGCDIGHGRVFGPVLTVPQQLNITFGKGDAALLVGESVLGLDGWMDEHITEIRYLRGSSLNVSDARKRETAPRLYVFPWRRES